MRRLLTSVPLGHRFGGNRRLHRPATSPVCRFLRFGRWCCGARWLSKRLRRNRRRDLWKYLRRRNDLGLRDLKPSDDQPAQSHPAPTVQRFGALAGRLND